MIPKKDLKILIDWSKRQNFYGIWMPREEGNYEMFNREHYWSDAYKFFQNTYYRHLEWTEIKDNFEKEDYPNKVALTTDKYYWESEFDYSKNDSLNILKPSRIIFDGLDMQYSARDGEYIDKKQNIVCFEASVYNESHQCLLIQKDKLLKFLDDNDLTIFWTMVGEKRFISSTFLGFMNIGGFSYLEDGEVINESIKVTYTDKEREKYSMSIDIDEVKE